MKKKHKISKLFLDYKIPHHGSFSFESSTRRLRTELVNLDIDYRQYFNIIEGQNHNGKSATYSNLKWLQSFEPKADKITPSDLVFIDTDINLLEGIKKSWDLKIKCVSAFDIVQTVADDHIRVFNDFKNQQIAELNEELKKLQKQYKQFRTHELALQIKQVICSIKVLAYEFISLRERQINATKNRLTSNFSRNLRFFYRSMIEFIFKNMDDESHDNLIVHYSTAFTTFFIVNDHLHGTKRTSNYSFN